MLYFGSPFSDSFVIFVQHLDGWEALVLGLSEDKKIIYSVMILLITQRLRLKDQREV